MDKKEPDLMQKALGINKTFSQIVLSDGDIGQIVQALSAFCRAEVLLTDSLGKTMVKASPDTGKLSSGEADVAEYSVQKEIFHNNNAAGLLSMTKSGQPVDHLDLMAVESAAVNISFILLKKQSVDEVEKNYRNEFLNALVDGDLESHQETVQRANLYGLNLSKPRLLIIFNIDYREKMLQDVQITDTLNLMRQSCDAALTALLSYSEDIIAWNRSNNIIVLYPVDSMNNGCSEEENREWAKDTAQILKIQIENSLGNVTVTVGLGNFYTDLPAVADSYREAVIAVKTGKPVWGKGKIYHYIDLGLYKILVSHPAKKELHAFVTETLGALAAYDKTNNTRLVYTLEQLLDNHQNQKITARKMFIHPKTLSYRKKRIEDILGLSLDDADTTFHLYAALKVMKILEVKE